MIYFQVQHCREALDHKWKMEVRVQGLNVFHGRRMNSQHHVTHDLHRKRPVPLYNDRSMPKSAWAHSMTCNPSLLSCKIEIDSKMLYWFPCLHSGWVFKTAHVRVWILTTVTVTVSAAHTIAVALRLRHWINSASPILKTCSAQKKRRHLQCFLLCYSMLSAQDAHLVSPSVIWVFYGAASVAAIHTWRGSLFINSETVMTLWH